MPGGKRVVFHEEGRKFVWYPASMSVHVDGGEVKQGCSHLSAARVAARSYNMKVRNRYA